MGLALMEAVMPDRIDVGDATLRLANVPPGYWNVSVEAIPDDLAHKARLVQYLERLPRALQISAGLYLHGPQSAGKTSCAVLVVKEALARRMHSFFVTAKDLSRYIIEGTRYDAEMSFVDMMHFCSVLVIDDLKPGSLNLRSTGDFLDDLLRFRMTRRSITVVTTTFAPGDLRGSLGHNIAEALLGHCVPIEVIGINFRQQAFARKRGEIFGEG